MFSGENFYATVMAESARWTAWNTGNTEGVLPIPAYDLKDVSTVVAIIEQSALFQTMVDLLDARDAYTAFHSQRVALMTLRLCFALRLPPLRTMLFSATAIVHDIGKIGIPDAILLKEERLSVEEYEKVKGHSAIGANILAKHKGVEPLCAGVLHHHERWNGTGYPNHLAGEDIPYAARLIALCDSIDAMLTDRVYRKALGSERAYTEIKRNRGTLYDPAVTEVCLLHWTYITIDARRVDGTVTAGEVPL